MTPWLLGQVNRRVPAPFFGNGVIEGVGTGVGVGADYMGGIGVVVAESVSVPEAVETGVAVGTNLPQPD